ncbi:MAG: FadR family transcriptional regulator [bacterium]|nr:MAG: FadR family transcriptional regulator [bacterium]
MFKPVKKTRVYEEIVVKVKKMIEKGRLHSGDQLPSERELAEVFNVSRSSVREALRSLETQGYLESRQGDGTYIARQPVETLVNPLANVIFTEKDGQMQLFEMRRIIEPQLAYLAAERATPEELDMLEKAVEEQERAMAKGESGMEVDKTFHYILAQAAGNKVILSIVDNIMDLLSESRDKYLQVEGRPGMSLVRHREILQAIKTGDKDLAARVMHEHLEDIERSLFQGVKGYKKQNKTRKGGSQNKVS